MASEEEQVKTSDAAKFLTAFGESIEKERYNLTI